MLFIVHQVLFASYFMQIVMANNFPNLFLSALKQLWYYQSALPPPEAKLYGI